jgi:hypothetical protein
MARFEGPMVALPPVLHAFAVEGIEIDMGVALTVVVLFKLQFPSVTVTEYDTLPCSGEINTGFSPIRPPVQE